MGLDRIVNKYEDDRAVSPVIGATLMVGMFTILMAGIGAFVLGFTPSGPPPNAELAFVETFPVTGSGVGVLVTLERGDRLQEENVEILVDGEVCNGWDGDGTITTGDGDATLVDDCNGEEIEDGDEMLVIWTDGGQSEILARHDVQWNPGTCGELIQELRNNGDYQLDEEITCTIGSPNDPVDGDLGVTDDGVLIGDVHLSQDGGQLELIGGAVDGDVSLEDDLTMRDGARIGGTLDTVAIERETSIAGSTVEGDLLADDDVTLTDQSQHGDSVVEGHVVAGDGFVTVDNGWIEGDVCTDDGVSDPGNVNGDVYSMSDCPH